MITFARKKVSLGGGLLGVILLFSSCEQQQKKKKETAETTVQTEETIDKVRSLSDYAYTDSLMQGSHTVVYSITSKADDELPTVVDEDGVTYKDNRFCLEITKDNSQFFNRSFTKADFSNMLSKEFQTYGIMDGMRFIRTEEGKLFFSACVSYPDSDMSCPFILTIGPDGSYTIAPDTSIDDETLPTQEQDI